MESVLSFRARGTGSDPSLETFHGAQASRTEPWLAVFPVIHLLDRARGNLVGDGLSVRGRREVPSA
jgi:hypothetical protein